MPELSEASIYEALGLEPVNREPGGGEGADDPSVVAGNESHASGDSGTPETAGSTPEDRTSRMPSPTRGSAEEGRNAGDGFPYERANDPAGDADAGTRENPPAAGSGDAGTAEKSETQSEAQRRENAARRRREEQQRAVDEAVAREREKNSAEWKAFFARAGLKNTITDQPITSLEEFDSWNSAFAAAKLQRELQSGKLTPESLNKAISDNPTVRRLEERAQKQEEAAKQSDSAAAQARIDAQIAELHKLDPSISSMEDLVKMPNAREFYEKVSAGNNFVDAWYLVNREKLAEQTAEAARQQALSSARSKEHLNGNPRSVGAGSIDVPADVMERYRFLNPGISDAEIREHYNKNHRHQS